MRGLWPALRAATAAFSLLAASAGVLAAPEATLAPSAAITCLTPVEAERGRPEYPQEMLRLKESSTVEVELVFKSPGSAPQVNFLNDTHVREFEGPVEAWASKLRMPCMAAGGEPVRLQQDFVFEPNDGRKVVYTAMSDPADARRRKLLECAVWPHGEGAELTYPDRAVRDHRQGILVVKARFVGPAQPPELEVVDNGGSTAFIGAARPYLERMRIPCMGSDPIDLHMFFDFRIPGSSGPRHVLNDMTLSAYLHLGEPSTGVYFDTTTMKCPFDVRLKFRQPFEPNGVSELESVVPARHAFLDWLAGVKFNVDPGLAKGLFGQESTLHIPCARIDL